MKYIGYSSPQERQHAIDTLPPDVIIIGEENIDLDSNGVPQTNRLLIEDDPARIADIRHAETARAQADNAVSIAAVAATAAQAETVGALSQAQTASVMRAALDTLCIPPDTADADAEGNPIAWSPFEYVGAGAVRVHDGFSYACVQPHITQQGWEPPAVPALWRVEEAPGAAMWQAGVLYAAGDERTYGGVLYRCAQGHTSMAGWEPPAVPALWTPV